MTETYGKKLVFSQNLDEFTRETDFWDLTTTQATFSALTDPTSVDSANISEVTNTADSWYEVNNFNANYN